MLVSLLVGFILGILALALAEGLALWCFVRRLGRKNVSLTEGPAAGEARVLGRDLSSERRTTFPYEKQGSLWVLEYDKIPKNGGGESQLKGAKEQGKNVIVEVLPVKKTASLNNHSLTLVDISGKQTVVPLLDCTVCAVSGSKLPSRKWYKKYPIKVENKSTVIYNGKNTCYLFAETSWEKESWCKALRLAADGSMVMRHSHLRQEFHVYLALLRSEYQLFQKTVPLSEELAEKSTKVDEQPSKFRHLFKKFVKKTSKYSDFKANSDLLLTGERRGSEKMRNMQDNLSANGSTRSSIGKSLIHDMVKPTSPDKCFSEFNQVLASDAAIDEHFNLNEGCLILNLFFSRIFFDIRKSLEVKQLIVARLQRTFSNMRIPSFIGGIACNDLDIGSLPPYIRDMRALPVDMNEMWASELDIEYSGGFSLNIETRLNIREPELQKEIVDSSIEASSSSEVASDILEGLECYSEELKLSNSFPDGDNRQDAKDKQEGLAETKSTAWAKSRWRTILNSVAEQVSQVPISMVIKIISLRGTLRLHIKAPPSDQLWFGFTSMPEIDFDLDSSIGERNIKNTHVGLFIANRFKVAIRDSIVLPNCESICIPWMFAEKDDWIPRSYAPFFWVRQESRETLSREAFDSQAGESKSKAGNDIRSKRCNLSLNAEDSDENSLRDQQSVSGSVSGSMSDIQSGSVSPNSLSRDVSLDELTAPLLEAEDAQARRVTSVTGSTETLTVLGANPRPFEDAGGKKMGKRAKMMDLGKKMTEKFEEKRRHIEEKGRHMVEKMRENVRAASDGGSSQRL